MSLGWEGVCDMIAVGLDGGGGGGGGRDEGFQNSDASFASLCSAVVDAYKVRTERWSSTLVVMSALGAPPCLPDRASVATRRPPHAQLSNFDSHLRFSCLLMRYCWRSLRQVTLATRSFQQFSHRVASMPPKQAELGYVVSQQTLGSVWLRLSAMCSLTLL